MSKEDDGESMRKREREKIAHGLGGEKEYLHHITATHRDSTAGPSHMRGPGAGQ